MAGQNTPKRPARNTSRLQDILSSLFSFRRDSKSKVGRAIIPTYEERLEEKEGDPLEKMAQEGVPEPLLRKVRREEEVNQLLTLLKGIAATSEQEVDVSDLILAYLHQILVENTSEEKYNQFLEFYNACPTKYQSIRSAQRLVAARCHVELKNQFAPWVYRVALRSGFNDKMKIFSADVLMQIDVSASENRSALFTVRKEMELEEESKNE